MADGKKHLSSRTRKTRKTKADLNETCGRALRTFERDDSTGSTGPTSTMGRAQTPNDSEGAPVDGWPWVQHIRLHRHAPRPSPCTATGNTGQPVSWHKVGPRARTQFRTGARTKNKPQERSVYYRTGAVRIGIVRRSSRLMFMSCFTGRCTPDIVDVAHKGTGCISVLGKPLYLTSHSQCSLFPLAPLFGADDVVHNTFSLTALESQTQCNRVIV